MLTLLFLIQQNNYHVWTHPQINPGKRMVVITKAKLLYFSQFSVVSDSVTPCSAACQAPLSLRFPRQEYWSGLPFPSPGDLPDPGIKPRSPAWQVDSLPLCHSGSPKLCFYLGLFFFLTLQYCISFAKYRNESSTGIPVFPYLGLNYCIQNKNYELYFANEIKLPAIRSPDPTT